jgi:hypothetical protein
VGIVIRSNVWFNIRLRGEVRFADAGGRFGQVGFVRRASEEGRQQEVPYAKSKQSLLESLNINRRKRQTYRTSNPTVHRIRLVRFAFDRWSGTATALSLVSSTLPFDDAMTDVPNGEVGGSA